ncbi:flagellar biosynthetic protein FliR, partial [Shewanella algae]|uniref:flagellar biosynthetic protein FliR n=1 Tax=Shewanella algae TaxID=38313 RepID=UPI00313F1FEA
LDWIALLLDSYRAFPPGVPWMSAARLGMIDGYAAQMFLTALTMALPISILLLVVQIVTGIIGRSAPALNLLALGLPAGVLAGIGALLASA